MDKILLVNKEKNYTSRDVINIISKHFNEKKVGHFGTLDPLATGLLVIGLGTYTKLGNLLPDETKTYIATVLVGTSTDTYDITGIPQEQTKKKITPYTIIPILNNLKGTYLQEVPVYSAVKVNGKKLYEYARAKEKVTLPKKEITIHSINFISLYEKENKQYFTFEAKASKGTYIRSLINDISKKTNIPMCMSDLKRTKCGNLSLESSYTIKDIKNNNFTFHNIENILDIEKQEIPESLKKQILNKNQIPVISSKYILFTYNGKNHSLYGKYKDTMKPYLVFKNQ